MNFNKIIRITITSFICSGVASEAGHGPGPGGGGGGGMGGGGMGGGSGLPFFATGLFAGSGDCASCHSQLTDSTGADVSMDADWRSTMMANSGKDPLWQAKLESEVVRNPALSGAIQEKCSRCHLPMARTQAVADGIPVGVLGAGFLNPNHYLHTVAMDGVSCALCHQIQAAGLGTEATFTGQYVIDLLTVKPGRLIFGQYPNPLQHPMQMHVGYTPVQALHVSESALCGSCHTLYTPVVNPDGTLSGSEFPEQTTYLEWAHTVAGGGVGFFASCQDCHLPEAPGAAAIANRPWHLAQRYPVARHHLVGANAFMLELIRNNAADLGVTADAAHFDATLARTTTQLQTQTAALSFQSAQVASGFLTLVARVDNLAGHKVPSGIPLRRAWIHLQVTDRKGRILYESGAPQADGSIRGNNADEVAGSYEPHYDWVERPDQVQIYESIMHDTQTQQTYTFLRAAGYLKDNRLLPFGFNKATALPDIAVSGGAASDPNFTGGSDEVTYHVSLPSYSGRLNVSARLLYQGVSRAVVQDLRQDGSPLVNRFATQYDAADRSPTVVAQTQIQL